jgi:hypothetical protein
MHKHQTANGLTLAAVLFMGSELVEPASHCFSCGRMLGLREVVPRPHP